MNELVLNNASTMSSREIAELCNTSHDSVLKTIRSLIEKGIVSGNETHYIHSQNGQKYPEFFLNYRDSMVVTSGYSVELRAKIIDRWQELESKQAHKLPQTFSQALMLASQQAEKIEALELQAKMDAPKIEFAMSVRRMEGACKVGDFAKVIGIGRNSLFAKLRLDQILAADNMPYQKYIDAGYFVVIEQIPYVDHAGKAHPAFTTMITGKGQVWLERKYRVAS